jgi:hypothetical protein
VLYNVISENADLRENIKKGQKKKGRKNGNF